MTSKTISNTIFWALLASFAGTAIWIHHRASFSFPVPWVDEMTMIWQAIAFQRDTSLISPILNPGRPILWYPPGYFVVAGSIFKILGFSYQLARDLSFVFVLAGFGFLVFMTKRFGYRLVSILFCGAFFLNKYFITAANSARAEALIFLIVSAGFFLILKRSYYKGLALLLLAPWVHLNGVYFFLGAVLAILLREWADPNFPKIKRSDIWVLVLVLIAWAGYGLYALKYWPAFSEDMSYQFLRKLEKDPWGAFLTPFNLGVVLVILFLMTLSLKNDPDLIPLLGFALASRMPQTFGQEMFYMVYSSLSYLLISIALIHLFRRVLNDIPLQKMKGLKPAVLFVFVLALVSFNYNATMIENPLRGLAGIQKGGLRIAQLGEPPYADLTDIQEISNFLESAASPGSPVTVEFYPQGDSVFFHDLDPDKVKISQPIFMDPPPAVDVRVVHHSRHMTKGSRDEIIKIVGEESKKASQVARQQIHESELWFLFLYRK